MSKPTVLICDVCGRRYVSESADSHDIGAPNVCCDACVWRLRRTPSGKSRPSHTCKSLPTVSKPTTDAYMRLTKPLRVYYFSYGYTRDPVKMTEMVQNKVLMILAKRDDIVPIVPHFVFDALYDYPDGYTHKEMSFWETEIISRCDGLVYDPNINSVGVNWEVAIAQKLGVPVYTYDEVAEGRDLQK